MAPAQYIKIMIIGVPREVKDRESRVGMVPAGVAHLVDRGHRVVIETDAGTGSGFADQEYHDAGAEVIADKRRLFAECDLIVKVKEPIQAEYELLRPGLLLFTYLHLASSRELTVALMERRVTGIAYETIETPDGGHPLLAPMSEVAGRLSVQIGMAYLRKDMGGSGVLLGGVPGVPRGQVTVVGGGMVGLNAVKVAMGLGADVTVLDINPARLAYLDDIFSGKLETLMSNRYNIEAAAAKADILVGAVYVHGAKAPTLVSEDVIRTMRPGSVVVDVAIDQGGCIATIKPTTHSNPTYTVHGVIHYGVTNMPGIVPRTSTFALTNATLPYVERIAGFGFTAAIKRDPALRLGVNVLDGALLQPGVAEAHGIPLGTLSL
jgi:alanine dehydrogenase